MTKKSDGLDGDKKVEKMSTWQQEPFYYEIFYHLWNLKIPGFGQLSVDFFIWNGCFVFFAIFHDISLTDSLLPGVITALTKARAKLFTATDPLCL